MRFTRLSTYFHFHVDYKRIIVKDEAVGDSCWEDVEMIKALRKVQPSTVIVITTVCTYNSTKHYEALMRIKKRFGFNVEFQVNPPKKGGVLHWNNKYWGRRDER